jgi:tetratricopeptide (TPR) repeat protein
VGALPAQVELHASLAQLAAYAADWERVRISTNASAELAEREGLVGKLSLPYTLRGLLLWREGRLDESTVLFQRAHDLAEQVGWSELAFQTLYGLAFTLRDSGDLDAAAAALDRAIDVCERAGLIAQSIQATGMRAVILAIGHRRSDAREAAEEASELAESLHYPVGNAAALEARGMADEDPEEGAALLAEAARAWQALDRPLEAARSRLLAGRVLITVDVERGRELLDAAAVEIDRLGVPHLAERARALAAG